MSKIVDYNKADEDALRDFAIAVLENDLSTLDARRQEIEAACTFDPHPQQQLRNDDKGVLRFRQNTLIRRLVDELPGGLNTIARWDATTEDRSQLAQLIGYSVSGYYDLNYHMPVNEEDVDE